MADKTLSEQAALVNKDAAEKAAKAQAEAKAKAEADVDARAAAKEKQNAEREEREANSQPTPTQRENDLARVGALNIDEKEDDGSEYDDEHNARVMSEKLPSNNPYVTRDTPSEPKAKRKKK